MTKKKISKEEIMSILEIIKQAYKESGKNVDQAHILSEEHFGKGITTIDLKDKKDDEDLN